MLNLHNNFEYWLQFIVSHSEQRIFNCSINNRHKHHNIYNVTWLWSANTYCLYRNENLNDFGNITIAKLTYQQFPNCIYLIRSINSMALLLLLEMIRLLEVCRPTFYRNPLHSTMRGISLFFIIEILTCTIVIKKSIFLLWKSIIQIGIKPPPLAKTNYRNYLLEKWVDTALCICRALTEVLLDNMWIMFHWAEIAISFVNIFIVLKVTSITPFSITTLHTVSNAELF